MPTQGGFTLIEMLVSVALFAVLVLVCIGALLSLVAANKKAQALEAVMNNLNISIDDMTRNLREGNGIACGFTTIQSGAGGDCPGGNTSMLSFEPYSTLSAPPRWVFAYAAKGASVPGAYASSPACVITAKTGGCIMVSKDGGNTYTQLTSPDVSISTLEFFVAGTQPSSQKSSNYEQPYAIIVIKGTANGTDAKSSSTFHIEAAADQRALNL